MNNRFDELYEIRLAQYSEIEELMRFIDEYWKKGHILSTNRDFFEYEMVLDGNVNFLIAKSKISGKIEGIIGFLPCSQKKEKYDVWAVVWKTIPDAMPMLGVELIKRLPEIIGARTVLGVGANPKTAVPLLGRICHYYTGKMNHYYRLADIDSYTIAKVNHKIFTESVKFPDINIMRLENSNMINDYLDHSVVDFIVPYKDGWYLEKRFLDHPVYDYQIWGIDDAGQKSILITRVQKYNGSKAVRIVDYLGDPHLFGKCGILFDNLLKDSEYIDFYFNGFDEQTVIDAGFIDVESYDNIIPDYFHPFEQRNVDIFVVSSNKNDRCIFFKGDGDQDRP